MPCLGAVPCQGSMASRDWLHEVPIFLLAPPVAMHRALAWPQTGPVALGPELQNPGLQLLSGHGADRSIPSAGREFRTCSGQEPCFRAGRGGDGMIGMYSTALGTSQPCWRRGGHGDPRENAMGGGFLLSQGQEGSIKASEEWVGAWGSLHFRGSSREKGGWLTQN